MEKDGRYENIKPLFISKTIRRYSDIFKVAIRKTAVAKDLKMNNNRFTDLINSPGEFKIRELTKQGDLFDLTHTEIIELIQPDYMHDEKDIDLDEKDSRYLQVKTMFKIGKITRFTDIFTYVPKYVVARDMKKGKIGLNDPTSFTVKQVNTIAILCELTFMEMFQLIDAQIKTKRGK